MCKFPQTPANHRPCLLSFIRRNTTLDLWVAVTTQTFTRVNYLALSGQTLLGLMFFVYYLYVDSTQGEVSLGV